MSEAESVVVKVVGQQEGERHWRSLSKAIRAVAFVILLGATALVSVGLTLQYAPALRPPASPRNWKPWPTVTLQQLEQSASRIDSLSQSSDDAALRHEAAALRERVGLLKREVELGELETTPQASNGSEYR